MNQEQQPHERPPSKTQRKREAHALQALAESLLKLPAAELAALPLPDRLREAIDDMAHMRGRGAIRRHRQYLGRMMREIDAEPIRAALAERRARERAANLEFRAIETWRERLLEDQTAIEQLCAAHAGFDRERLRRLVSEAHAGNARGGSPRAARALFRYLRDVMTTAR